MSAEDAVARGLAEVHNEAIVAEAAAIKKAEESKTPISELDKQIEKLKADNDLIQKELLRKQDLLLKVQLAGRAQAGQYTLEKTPQQLAQEEAAVILKPFGF